MGTFEGDSSTRGRLTSLRNKPQQKQPRQLSASIHARIVSQCIRLSFDGGGVSCCCVRGRRLFSNPVTYSTIT